MLKIFKESSNSFVEIASDDSITIGGANAS
jgi:hypothetical protein